MAGSDKDDPRAEAPHGIWQLRVHNASSRGIKVDAWIERDDPALGDRGPRRQARFVDEHIPTYVKKTATLNSVATGARSIVVGGFLQRGRIFEDGKVTEGTSSNAYIVKDNKIITRPISNSILNGCTRRALFRMAKEHGVEIEERLFTPEEAYAADEAFLTSASQFVMPITEIDGKRIGGGQPGPVVRKMRELFLEEAQK